MHRQHILLGKEDGLQQVIDNKQRSLRQEQFLRLAPATGWVWPLQLALTHQLQLWQAYPIQLQHSNQILIKLACTNNFKDMIHHYKMELLKGQLFQMQCRTRQSHRLLQLQKISQLSSFYNSLDFQPILLIN